MTIALSRSAGSLVDYEATEDVARDPGIVRVGVGVVTYNNAPSQLQRLLRSIEHAASRVDLDQFAAKFVTIDCGSPAEWGTSSLPFQVLEYRGNLGFGGGMNALMAEAFSDLSIAWFLCVNPDGTLHHALFSEMLECSLRYPNSLIEARQFPEEHPKPYDSTTGETLWASGACLLIPRRIYETIGGFDPHIFMYMEDVDFSWRARAAGFTVRVAPRCFSRTRYSTESPTTGLPSSTTTRCVYLAWKWGRPIEQAAYEHALRDFGFYEGHELPPLPDTAPVPPDGRHVADFSYGFVFSPRRW